MDLEVCELTHQNRLLYEALDELVKVNEQHNAEIEKIIGRPVGWKDTYLDKARAALKHVKENPVG